MKATKSNILHTAAAIMMAAVCFTACQHSQSTPAISKAERWQQLRLAKYQDSIYPDMRQLVTSGDLITRLGTDITSEMMRQMNLTDPSFSHCGIASIEHDTVFVYHAIGGEFNPDQKLKREPLYSFGYPTDNKALGIFRPAMALEQKKQVLQLARDAYDKELKFDMKFDYADDDRQYCAEFVAKCYTRGLHDSLWLLFTRKGEFSYVAVDNLFRNNLMKQIGRYAY